MALDLTLNFSPVLGDGTNLSLPQYKVSIPVGPKGVCYNFDVPTSDTTIDLGDVSEIGYVSLHNRAEAVLVTTPSAPVVTNQGSAGATTWTYKVVAKQADGTYSAASAAGTTTTGNATLTGSNFNRLTWDAVAGAQSYDIYRTAAGGTPSSTGLIGNTSNLTFDDTGLTGDASTAPATAADNMLLVGHTSGTYPLNLLGTEPAAFRWNGVTHAAIHVKANTRIIPVEFLILDN